MTNDPNNAADPAAGIPPAARPGSVPRWLSAAWIAAFAALIALFYGQETKIWTAVVFLVGMGIVIVATLVWQRRQGMRPAHGSDTTPAGRVTLLIMILVLTLGAPLLRAVVTPGAALSFGIQFLYAAMVLSVGLALRTHFDARPRSDQ